MNTNFCCEIFPKLIPSFEWYSFLDEEDTLYDDGESGEKIHVMPCLSADGQQLRVNNCPSCGAYVRDINIPESDFKTLL